MARNRVVESPAEIQVESQANNQAIQYSVDMVLCIDQTGSMGSIINRVKQSALSFYDDIQREMQKMEKAVSPLRIKVIGFRDYACEDDREKGLSPMDESPFFTLPDQREGFSAFINELKAAGGGDAPESGLEALALAIKSEWNLTGDKNRQIIVVWTDTSTHPIGKGSDHRDFPENMPKDIDELSDLWSGQTMNESAKRLILYAPDAPMWNDIAQTWFNVLIYPSKAGEGLSDVDYHVILSQIANSV